mmetsp:Transcript_26880/g.74081  ORF Transcript_26880/g.74081 Transcript_26880/m.74081 type:complete len:217 (-) Transcript_26880:617-1267(-)
MFHPVSPTIIYFPTVLFLLCVVYLVSFLFALFLLQSKPKTVNAGAGALAAFNHLSHAEKARIRALWQKYDEDAQNVSIRRVLVRLSRLDRAKRMSLLVRVFSEPRQNSVLARAYSVFRWICCEPCLNGNYELFLELLSIEKEDIDELFDWRNNVWNALSKVFRQHDIDFENSLFNPNGDRQLIDIPNDIPSASSNDSTVATEFSGDSGLTHRSRSS